MTPTILFEGKDLLLRANTGAPGGPLVVTFSALSASPEDRERGFAEALLNKLGVNNLVFISSWNHWWQTAEMPQAIASAREHIRALAPTRVAGCGSSMGGYGALLLSGDLAFSDVVALGPQYSVDPRKAGFDDRWLEYSRKLEFLRDDMDNALQSAARKHVVFDSRGIDGIHVSRMRGNALHKRPMPYCGHNIGAFLKASGHLRPLLQAMAAGTLNGDLPGILLESRRRRGENPKYQHALLDRVDASTAHGQLAKRLARSFVKRNPEDPVIRERLAGYLLRDGNLDGARRHAEVALRHGAGKAGIRALLARIEEKAAAE